MERTKLGRVALGAAIGAMLALLVWREIIEGQGWRGALLMALGGGVVGFCIAAFTKR